MSIKKMLVGTTASLLLAGGFATTSTASASEYGDVPVEKSVVEKSSGIQLPIDMKVGDTYKETVEVNGKEVNYTVTKNDEQLSEGGMTTFDTADELPQTVPVSGRASFTVSGDFGANSMSFALETYQGQIDSVTRPRFNYTAGVDSDTLTLENPMLASYRIVTSLDIEWLGGPTSTQTLEATIDNSGANQNINYLVTTMY